MADCIFCEIVAGRIPATRVAEDAHTLAFMDINPGVEGHVLVIPKTHAADIFTIAESDLDATLHTARRVALAARQALECTGVNLFQSNGAVAFQSVFHFHVHVLPRREGDAIHRPWDPGKTDMPAIQGIADRLRAAMA
jgi:histidine triad (HIT) family protein